MTLVRMNKISNNALVKMDETAVYFGSQSNCAVNEKGAKTVSVRCGRIANECSTVCIAVAANGTKLLLFFIIKGAVSGPIANTLQEMLPAGVCGLKVGCTTE